MTKEGYNCYQMYLALQKHFSSSYDYFQYNGKVRASTDAYQKRNDMFSFEKLTKIVPQEDLQDFFVCHFLENPKEWIRSMNKTNLEKYQARMRLLPKTFRENLQRIRMEGPAKVMRVESDIPIIHKMAIAGDIELETLLLIDWMVPFIETHESLVKVPFVFPEHVTRLKKYRPFLKNKLVNDYNYFVEVFRDEMLE